MPQYWISFRSLTHAQRASRILERKGMTAAVTRLPQGVSPKGCGYALILRRQPEAALRLIREAQIPVGLVFEKTQQGDFREMRL
jgi:hypothetical protein